jgi:hypothetical protein
MYVSYLLKNKILCNWAIYIFDFRTFYGKAKLIIPKTSAVICNSNKENREVYPFYDKTDQQHNTATLVIYVYPKSCHVQCHGRDYWSRPWPFMRYPLCHQYGRIGDKQC